MLNFLDCVDHNIMCNIDLNCDQGFFQEHCPMSCNLCTIEPNERAINENPSLCIAVSPISGQPTNTAETIREAGLEMKSLLDEMKTVVLAQFHEKCLNLHVNPQAFIQEVMRMIMPGMDDEKQNLALKIESLDAFKTELIGLREDYNGSRRNETNVLKVLDELRLIIDDLMVLLENVTPTDCDQLTMICSEIDNFHESIPPNPCNGIVGCCTDEHQCGEGEGVCEVGTESSGCMSGLECGADNCPEGEDEFNCCTSEST